MTLVDLFADGVDVFDLGQPFTKGMPHSANHPAYTMSLMRRHGDATREDGSSSANELIVTGGHVGTHIDALAHVSFQGRLHGGVSAEDAQRGGLFAAHGVETLGTIVAPGVLLDIPGLLGVETLEGGHAVTAEELAAAGERAGVDVRPGTIVLVRTGWGRLFGDPVAFLGHESGVPGPDEGAARWLAERGIRGTGSDTTAYEHIPPGEGHRLLPAHRILLVESGIPIMEMLALEDLAAAGVASFGFVASPLKLVGATGSPVRPLALVER